MFILTLVLIIIVALCAAVIAMMFKKLAGLREDLELAKKKAFRETDSGTSRNCHA